ncbi:MULTISPECIES: MFS transporter [unclassified Arthrobacter]|uniref:MFS transporter n=1 Tax=unclassified Arthrobacter TaxID=235627 RepID=UPI001D14A991|nr:MULTISPECIES: MFS transporter [unclassified Arthrobacter]MCC3275158.1 MFS transporter [Arthrobacter sp. zg-Y20]MCC3278235.1 MFS transporter [Arthrobacter sp. zg-Y40]MCC9176605.1 MFS transporter [Arthrobacter sp. zg-Y750]MDK1315315.1 MFS transporter [Arthrobacter sp. zg.Y20]MDK1326692.1 MFS transporter [Arthrobacter sp. zg-Y1143]
MSVRTHKEPAGAAPASKAARWKQVAAWAAWDWGSASFNAVMTTFVFTVYLTSNAFGDTDDNSAVLGAALAVAGVAVALLAPITGQRSDAGGRRRTWLTVNTLLTCVLMAACWLVLPSPDYLILGVVLIAVANLFFEFAGVNYNAMLSQVSTPASVGKVSGLGWAMGYVGGIAALALVLVGFVQPEVGWFGVTSENGLNLRSVALFSAVWFLLFALPLMFAVPEVPRQDAVARIGFLASYKLLFRRIKALYKTDRHTIYFLLASAVFRDGLAAVFTFGGVIAAGTFGWELSEVIMFAIFGNVIAAVGSVIGGFLDDRAGPKPVIIGALIGLILAGTAVVVLGPGNQDMLGLQWSGDTTFWIFGLLLCLFVGPAQAASRAFLARLAPVGKEGELFGLYATTGRAVSFLAPTLFSACIVIFGAQRYGIIGIVAVLLLGLLVLLPVRSPGPRTRSGDRAGQAG